MGAEPLHRTSNLATSFNEQNSSNDREPTLPILFLLLFSSVVKGSPSPVSRCWCCLPKELERVAGPNADAAVAEIAGPYADAIIGGAAVPYAGAIVAGAPGPYAGAIVAGAAGPHAGAAPAVAKVNLGKTVHVLRIEK